MKIKRYMSIVLLLIAFNTIVYTNCSKVNFEAMPEKVAGSGDDTGIDPDGPSNPDDPDEPVLPPTQVIKNCKTALETGELRSINRDIVFEDSRVETGKANICEFEKGDNLTMKNNYLRARYTQGQILSLPAGAVICGAEMETDEQSFRFDDMFFLTFNDYVLASSIQRSLPPLEKQSIKMESSGKSIDLYRYDWLKVRDASFQGINEQSNDYCLGKAEMHSSCSWPLSQQQGKITLAFDPELLINIGLRPGNGPQRFGFVITGDDDPSQDCYHERLAFKTKVYYYIQ